MSETGLQATATRSRSSAPSEDPRIDVAVIGGGLAGSIAALQLARQGRSVALLDLHEAPRPEFRAEQLVGPQVRRLAALGLLEEMTRGSALRTEVLNARHGRIVDLTRVEQYGVPYEVMVRAARAALPSSVEISIGRVASIDTGPESQRVWLSSGEAVEARLVVMATGLSTVLTKRLGMDFRVVRAGHSLAVGFDLRLREPLSSFMPVIYYGERTRDRMDYLALFEMHGTTRANLFCYQDQGSAWARAFYRDPKGELLAVLPGLRRVIGDFDITSPVQMRANDLRVAQNPARDGVVLVGDAFQTPCPAAGTGIDRLLSDLDILCGEYLPAWLASPGMRREKIASYYADAVKTTFDAECLRIADYRRAVSTREGLWWTVHRKQVFLRRRMSALLTRHRIAPGSRQTMSASL